jgi:hypothetical protein
MIWLAIGSATMSAVSILYHRRRDPADIDPKMPRIISRPTRLPMLRTALIIIASSGLWRVRPLPLGVLPPSPKISVIEPPDRVGFVGSSPLMSFLEVLRFSIS